jgi:hypothetical protein
VTGCGTSWTHGCGRWSRICVSSKRLAFEVKYAINFKQARGEDLAHRNFSMIDYFNQRTDGWNPQMSFKGNTKADWEAWRGPALEKLLESVPCTVLKPVDMAGNKGGAAILCSHGHGPYGKEPVTGNASSEGLRANIARHNYSYAEEMARRGFLTISPDLRGFGERSDGGDPYPGRDRCNVHFVRGIIMGLYTLTLNIWDMKCCIDYLQTRPEVDPERIGMMGLSQGGTMTAFTAAVEPRIKAADIIAYVNPWKRFGIQDANFCGSQIVPDIYRYFDTHDISGLIAPRPLLLEMGVYDTCFPIEDLLKGYEGVRRIYEAAGVAGHLWADVHLGEHAFADNKAYAFFKKYL